MLSGKMPIEHFPETTECQGSIDEYYTQHKPYKIFPNVFLTDASGTKPSTSANKFEKGVKQVLPINKGIFINDASCPLQLRSALGIKNYINVKYTGKIPFEFYGPKTKAGTRFKLVITNNDLDERHFIAADDNYVSTGSKDKTAFYD